MQGQWIMTEREFQTIRSKGRSHSGSTILVADECAVVNTLARRMLEMLGYRVITARSGPQALNLITSCRDTVGLVILDMVLLRRTEPEIRDRLCNIPLELPVLIWSGYPPDTRVREFLAQGRSDYLQKPFEMDELSIKIVQLLADSSRIFTGKNDPPGGTGSQG